MRGRVVKIIVAAASVAVLGGCFHIPARAWANGRELGYDAGQQVIYGDHNAAAQRQMYSRLQSSAFGHQWVYPTFGPHFRTAR
jgi:hypothetical protein